MQELMHEQMEIKRSMALADKASDEKEILTLEEFRHGLTDSCYTVRMAMAYRKEFALTDAQIEAGLTDEHENVREAFLLRTDIHLQQEQIHRALSDPFLDTFVAAFSRPDLNLLDCDIDALTERINSINDFDFVAHLRADLECRLQAQMAIDVAHKRNRMFNFEDILNEEETRI